MSNPTPDSNFTRPGVAPSLTHQAASGVAWSGFVALSSKAVAFLGQILLAWLLMPADFGLIALMFGVMMFINLIREAGLRQVLTQRQNEFDQLAGSAIRISGALGLIAAGTLILSASGVAHLLGAPILEKLLYVMAISCPIDALTTVPATKLQIDLRFRYLAKQSFALSLLQMCVTLILAWLGYGAFSIAWALVIATIVRSATTWIESGIHPFRTRFSGSWLGLVQQSSIVAGSYLLYIVILQSDRFILQVFRDESAVGIYFFAYNLSVQTLVLTSSNLAGVLLPMLSRLKADAPRQVHAFLRAVRLMMLIGVPICFLLSTLADPLLRWLFKPEYYPAVWPLRLLSLSMAFQLAGYCAVSLLQAQGRFRIHGAVMAGQLPLWLIAASMGALWGGATGVALAAVCVSAIIDPIIVLLSVRKLETTPRVLYQVFGRPVLLSVLALVPTLILSDTLGLFGSLPFFQVLFGGVLSLGVYWLLINLLAPTDAAELRRLAAPIIRRACVWRNR